MSTPYDVVIIGAGISGLYAARTLSQQGVKNFLVIEATNIPGGRMKLMDELPIDAGGEFVHGEKESLLKQYFVEKGWKFEEREWPDWWFFPNENKWVGPDDTDPRIDQALDWIIHLESVDLESLKKKDQTPYEFLRAKGATDEQLSIVDCFVQDFGCSVQEASMLELKNENDHWNFGENYLVLLDNRPLYSVVQSIVSDIGNSKIKYNFPIAKIDYSRPLITLTSTKNSMITCKRVIVTVSLNVLKSGKIVFNPTLPQEKVAAMSRLKMNNTIKVILVFHEQIWPNNGMWDVCCPGAYVQELWMKEVADPITKEPRFVLTCYFAGNKVYLRTKEEKEEGIAKVLAQLDQMFSTKSSPKIASQKVKKILVEDYSTNPYVLGGYVYPTLGAHLDDRAVIGKPINNNVFFAGEAVHPHVNPTIQAAMEMGQQAATQAAVSLKSSKL